MSPRTVGARLVVYLLPFYRLHGEYVFPLDVTQLGMSRGLGIGRTHAGNELKKLEDEGTVEVKKAYVAGEKGKRNVYLLTQSGWNLAKRLAETAETDAETPSKPGNGGTVTYSDVEKPQDAASDDHPTPTSVIAPIVDSCPKRD